MMKLDNWQYKFDMFLDKAYCKEFAWGSWDCCKFADACIQAMTGESLIPKALHWTDEDSALKSIKKYGGTLNESIKKACKGKLEEVAPAKMMKGDLVVYKEITELVGMTDGMKIIGPTDGGLTFKQNAHVLSVWRIANG
jgi:hypothetical protein